MLDPFSFLVLALACWRVSFLLTKEHGPFHIMSRLRERTTLGGLLSCLFCASVWVAFLCLVLWYNTIGQVVMTVFALSGAAMLAHRYTGGDLG